MAATAEDRSLVSQCLDFSQMLAGKGLSFAFSLTVGNNFSFSVDTRGKGALSSQIKKKKKPTPSTLRRNARRREQFLKKKLASAADESQHVPVLKTPEKELSPPPSSDLNLTPVLGEGREEPPVSPSTPLAAEETRATPVATSFICDLPLKCKGGAKCFEIWSREHGLTKCGKSFKSDNDLIIHAQNNHNYCLEHERMWYKCLPCKLREQDNELL